MELQAVAAAVESSGQAKAEAQVSETSHYYASIFTHTLGSHAAHAGRCHISHPYNIIMIILLILFQAQAERLLIEGQSAIECELQKSQELTSINLSFFSVSSGKTEGRSNSHRS